MWNAIVPMLLHPIVVHPIRAALGGLFGGAVVAREVHHHVLERRVTKLRDANRELRSDVQQSNETLRESNDALRKSNEILRESVQDCKSLLKANGQLRAHLTAAVSIIESLPEHGPAAVPAN